MVDFASLSRVLSDDNSSSGEAAAAAARTAETAAMRDLLHTWASRFGESDGEEDMAKP